MRRSHILDFSKICLLGRNLITIAYGVPYAGFHSCTFVYIPISPKIQFLYSLLSSVALWVAPWYTPKGRSFEL